jgi:hypothetical protein
MKGQKKEERFSDIREVKKKTLEVLNNISTEKFSRNVFSSGKNVVTSVKGEYFEGDWSCNGINPNRPLKKSSGYFWFPPRNILTSDVCAVGHVDVKNNIVEMAF